MLHNAELLLFSLGHVALTVPAVFGACSKPAACTETAAFLHIAPRAPPVQPFARTFCSPPVPLSAFCSGYNFNFALIKPSQTLPRSVPPSRNSWARAHTWAGSAPIQQSDMKADGRALFLGCVCAGPFAWHKGTQKLSL